jgi:hypothetical protein
VDEDKADALIAALTAELEEAKGERPTELHPDSILNRNPLLAAHFDALDEPKDAFYHMWLAELDRAEQAEADLQTIKALLDEVEQREARRCGTCALWQEWKPGSWDCAEEWCGYSTNPETFGCTHWEQRREG